ncbi:hypothetical protein KPL70_024087 [Citrus sinensis]|nr:hypothetical protein KPL70_024087 [Citrus sinensis]
METKHQNEKPSILMLPWLAHGHITPYLALAKKLSQQNFHIYFCSTSINLQSISQGLRENFAASIQLTDLQLPCTFPELHDPYNHTTKNIPRRLIPTLIAAFDAAKPSFCNVLETLKPTLQAFLFFLHNSSLKFPFPEFDLSESDIQKMTQFKHRIVNGTENKDRKESSSVVYVSFGSEYFLSKEEMNDIASGLLLSEAKILGHGSIGGDEEITVVEKLLQLVKPAIL